MVFVRPEAAGVAVAARNPHEAEGEDRPAAGEPEHDAHGKGHAQGDEAAPPHGFGADKAEEDGRFAVGGSFGIHAAPVVAIGVQHIRARLNRDAAQKREQEQPGMSGIRGPRQRRPERQRNHGRGERPRPRRQKPLLHGTLLMDNEPPSKPGKAAEQRLPLLGARIRS